MQRSLRGRLIRRNMLNVPKQIGLGVAIALLLGNVLPMATAAPSDPAIGTPVAPAPVPSPDPALAQDEYILGAGDVLSLSIVDVPEYGGSYAVLNDGSVSLPELGPVVVQGLTLSQARAWLTRLYLPYVKRPTLTLSIARPRPIRFSIAGEVQRPGAYSLNTLSFGQGQSGEQVRTTTETGGIAGQGVTVSGWPTLSDALQKAGGIRQLADIRQIQLRRQLPGRTGQEKVTTVNLWELIRTGVAGENLVLYDGDTIFVPQADQIPESEILEIAKANFAPQVINVYVVGEVGRPGLTQIPASTPLNQAILAAGGFLPSSNTTVSLVRLNRNGTASRQRIKVDLGAGIQSDRNPPLRDTDSIIVERNTWAIITDTLERIVGPVSRGAALYRIFD
jgi:polysaccharide biosynthesis/export protein